MSLLVAVAAVLLVLWMQRRSGVDRLADMRADHTPDAKLVDPDETFHLDMTLQNMGRHYILFAQLEERLHRAFTVRDPDIPAWEVRSGETKISFSTWLPPRRQVRFRVPVSISARGVYCLAPLKFSIGDFLGLQERSRLSDKFRAVVVAPKEAEDQGFADVLGGFLGNVSVRRFIHEDPALFTGFREYTGREPMKQISWYQSAKGQGLMVKILDHTAEPQVSVLVNADTRAKERGPLLEKCYSMARTICRVLEERGIAYDFAVNAELASSAAGTDNTVGEGLGANHFAAVLGCLGQATYVRAASGDEFLAEFLVPAGARGHILITPSDDFAASRVLERLRELSGGTLLVLQADRSV